MYEKIEKDFLPQNRLMKIVNLGVNGDINNFESVIEIFSYLSGHGFMSDSTR